MLQKILWLCAVLLIEITAEGLLLSEGEGDTRNTILLKKLAAIYENKKDGYERHQIFNDYKVLERMPVPPMPRKKRNTTKFDSSSSKCTYEKKTFKIKFSCYYDNACFETFYDCYINYEKFCGIQTVRKSSVTGVEKSMWTCVTGAHACVYA